MITQLMDFVIFVMIQFYKEASRLQIRSEFPTLFAGFFLPYFL